MAKQQPDKGKTTQAPPVNNVVGLPLRCPVDNCGHKPKRSAFCEEHFMWFKEGLVNRQGQKPKDFDKKYQAYLRRKEAA